MASKSNQHHRAVRRAALETLETRRLLSLAAPVAYPAGFTQALATGDFNGDGRSDVVSATSFNNTVSLRLSNPDGTLQAAQNFPTGAVPQSIAVGDFNNDGKRDVVTGNGGGHVSVLLGNGNGTLQPPLNTQLPPQLPPGYTGNTPLPQEVNSVAVGDMNGDGKMDLVVGASARWFVTRFDYYGNPYTVGYAHAYVDVMIGNGNGTFGNANVYGTSNSTTSVGGLGDFNGDNKLDVVTGSVIDVWAGNGNGTLQPPVPVITPNPGTFAICDLDNDGKLDLVLNTSALFFYKGQGNATFQSPVQIGDQPARSIVSGDVNGDGTLDLVLSTQKTTFEYYGPYGNYNPTTVDSTKVLLGYGDGTFTLPVTTTLGSHPDTGSPNVSALGDFNGDAKPDLVAMNPSNATMYVQLNQGNWIVPPGLRVSDVTVSEGNAGTTNAVFTVTLSPTTNSNVSVNYGTVSGSAVEGADFVGASGTLNFSPGQTSKTVTVQVKGDRIAESEEVFSVDLTGAINADIIDGSGLGTIAEDEPRISINDISVTEGDSGTTPAVFTVTLSNVYDQEVTVDYSTLTGHTTDIIAASGTVHFAPGVVQQTITIQVVGDRVPEELEAFWAILANPSSNASFADSDGYALIFDNDVWPSIVVSDVTRAEGNSGTTPFQFTVSLSIPSAGDVSVNYATASGTATSSGGQKDYTSTSGTLTFAAGQVSRTVVVAVSGDTRSETDETFFLNLSNVANATIADAQGVGTILNDETRGKKWIGATSGGNWSTAANWSPSGVPVADSLVTISGASVTLSGSATVGEISLIGGAKLTLAANGSNVLRTPGLFVDSPSRLNLTDNDLIVDYVAGSSPLGAWNAGSFDGICGQITSGRNGGAWNGNGIVTSSASGNLTTLAAAEAAKVLGISGTQTKMFSGQAVDSTTVLVKFTYAGDANLDGKINVDDYGRIDFNVNLGTQGWFNGDFNYDGKINVDDYGIIDFNVSIQGAPFAGAAVASTDRAAPTPDGGL